MMTFHRNGRGEHRQLSPAAVKVPRRHPMPEFISDAARVDALGDYFIEVVVKLRHDGRLSDEEADKLIEGWDQVALYGVH